MKHITAITMIGLIFAASAASVFAQVSAGNRVIPPSKGLASGSAQHVKEQKKQIILNDKLEALKKRAESEITRRITSLTNVSNRISTIKRLTDAQKTSLITSINNEITSLNGLNSKIQSDTDIDTSRQDIKSIVTSYRIYLLYLPEARIIIAADGILNAADKFSSLSAKLQTQINAEKNKGKDTSSLQAAWTDMQTKIAEAKSEANNAITTVSSLQPTDFPGNKANPLQIARGMLQVAWKDLQIARQDAQTIIVGLKLNKRNGDKPVSASGSAGKTIHIPLRTPSTSSSAESIE